LSNTSNKVTVYDLPSYLNNQTNITITIRPHFTLSDLSQISSGLTAYSDTLTYYGPSNQVISYFYTSSGFLADDYVTPMGHAIVYPGVGVILCPSYKASLTFVGQVKTTKTIVPVYAGITIIAPIDPMGNSKIQTASLLDPYSDSMSLVSIDGSLSLTSFYSDGTNLLNENFNPTTAPFIETGNGAIINIASDKLWTNIAVIN